MANLRRKATALAFTGIGTSLVAKQGLADTRGSASAAVASGMIRAVRVRRTAGTGAVDFTVVVFSEDDTIANGAQVLINKTFTSLNVQGAGDANLDSQSGAENYEVVFNQRPFVSILAASGSAHGVEVVIEYSDAAG